MELHRWAHISDLWGLHNENKLIHDIIWLCFFKIIVSINKHYLLGFLLELFCASIVSNCPKWIFNMLLLFGSWIKSTPSLYNSSWSYRQVIYKLEKEICTPWLGWFVTLDGNQHYLYAVVDLTQFCKLLWHTYQACSIRWHKYITSIGI